jgi:hypothetical protein
VLELCSSPDLVEWTARHTLLQDDSGFGPDDSVSEEPPLSHIACLEFTVALPQPRVKPFLYLRSLRWLGARLVLAKVKFTGFHYADWHFDGTDLMVAVRTAYRGANSYHNSNRATYARLRNYRALLPP